MNNRITNKERNLLKSAFRRIFSRSDLRKAVLTKSEVSYTDALRPRVKKWSECSICHKFHPTYLMDIDHKDPVVPLNKSMLDMTLDELADRIWCDVENLAAICKECHNSKSKAENKLRREYKKGLK